MTRRYFLVVHISTYKIISVQLLYEHCITKLRIFAFGYLRGTIHVFYGNRKSLYSQKTVKRRQTSNFDLYHDQS